MTQYSIRDKCHINTNYDTDTFVGIRCDKGTFSVNFPLGFCLPDNDKELRKDILLLVNTIASTTRRRDSDVVRAAASFNELGFPIQAYLYLINDYISRGYYRERETHYHVSVKGKINWGRTIKTQKPYVQDQNAYYLKFVTKENAVNESEIISLIHEYCVYESFQKMGWLFTAVLPKKPRIRFNKRLFLSVVQEKLVQTYNDRNKALFRSMLAVINEEQREDSPLDFRYGTYRFEYVWEALIDRVFGIEGKSAFFPKTMWLLDGKYNDNACLEPDSIMLWNGNVYVLDAKYYKYGATKRPWDLPESTSINKQITYGEYISGPGKISNKLINGKTPIVYNAFLMPYDRQSDLWKSGDSFLSIGEAISTWKSNEETYERIQGILVDVKHLMKVTVLQDESEISQLAACIEAAIEKRPTEWQIG